MSQNETLGSFIEQTSTVKTQVVIEQVRVYFALNIHVINDRLCERELQQLRLFTQLTSVF